MSYRSQDRNVLGTAMSHTSDDRNVSNIHVWCFHAVLNSMRPQIFLLLADQLEQSLSSTGGSHSCRSLGSRTKPNPRK